MDLFLYDRDLRHEKINIIYRKICVKSILGVFSSSKKGFQRRNQDPWKHLRWRALQQKSLYYVISKLSILDVFGGPGNTCDFYPNNHVNFDVTVPEVYLRDFFQVILFIGSPWFQINIFF